MNNDMAVSEKLEAGVKTLLSSSCRGIPILKLSFITVLSLLFATMPNVGAVSAQTFLFKFGSFGTGEGQFSAPSDLSVDSSDNIYVVDTNNFRIQKFDKDGKFLRMWGFGVSFGREQFEICTFGCREGIQGPGGNGQFLRPQGIAVDIAGNVYVVDSAAADFNPFRIQVFNSNGDFLFQFGTRGSGNGQFRFPRRIAVDGAGSIYVADSGNHRIQAFDASGNFLFKFGNNGTGDGQFMLPTGVAVDFAGNIIVVDQNNNRVQKFDSQGNFVLKFGSVGDGDGQFLLPESVAVDREGNIYVSDRFNARVQLFDPSGNFLFKFGSVGSGDGQFNQGGGGPSGIAVDGSGKIYVSDIGIHRIQVFGGGGQGGPEPSGGGSGGCSLASAGATPSITLYLLLPVPVLFRRRIGGIKGHKGPI